MDIVMHINDTYVSVCTLYYVCARESNKMYDLLECVEYLVRPEIDQPQGVVPDTAQQVIAIWNTNVNRYYNYSEAAHCITPYSTLNK
jgi:hypothetical protein